MQIPGPHPRSAESETLRVDQATCVSRSPGDSNVGSSLRTCALHCFWEQHHCMWGWGRLSLGQVRTEEVNNLGFTLRHTWAWGSGPPLNWLCHLEQAISLSAFLLCKMEMLRVPPPGEASPSAVTLTGRTLDTKGLPHGSHAISFHFMYICTYMQPLLQCYRKDNDKIKIQSK